MTLLSHMQLGKLHTANSLSPRLDQLLGNALGAAEGNGEAEFTIEARCKGMGGQVRSFKWGDDSTEDDDDVSGSFEQMQGRHRGKVHVEAVLYPNQMACSARLAAMWCWFLSWLSCLYLNYLVPKSQETGPLSLWPLCCVNQPSPASACAAAFVN